MFEEEEGKEEEGKEEEGKEEEGKEEEEMFLTVLSRSDEK